MTETRESVTWLTQEAYDRLKHELDFLTGEGRAEIVSRIEAAREEGDLKENGGYHAAKDEQGKREARIRQLQQLLESAQVGEAPPDDGVVEPGTIVTARARGRRDAVPARARARWPATASRSTRRSRRSAPRSSASARVTPRPTRRPAARS